MKTLIVFSIVISSVVLSSQALRYVDCGSKGSKVTSVAVTGCAKLDTCTLPKGKNATITVEFTTSAAFTKASAVVHGIVAGIPVPFGIPNPDGCKNCDLTCPSPKGSADKYSTNIFIKSAYPKVRVVVKWELKNEKSEDIFCIEIPAEVVDSPSVNRIP